MTTVKNANPYSGMSTADRWKAFFDGKINLDDCGFFFDSDPCLTQKSSILVWEPNRAMQKFFPLLLSSHFEGKIEVNQTVDETIHQLKKHDFDILIIGFEPSPESLIEKCRLAGFKKPIIAYSVFEGSAAMREVLRHRINGYVRKLKHDFNSLAELLKMGGSPKRHQKN